MEPQLITFQDKQIRRIFHEGEWYFSILDIVKVLTNTYAPSQYWDKIKKREFEAFQLSPIWLKLKLPAADGKLRPSDCATTRDMFRIIQSIPSPKAEPFKQWLAQVGYERVQEIENPELAQERMVRLYEAKGYPQEWIEKRVQSMAIRNSLTEEWKERGIDDSRDFAILTSEIAKATFGVTPSEHKYIKGLTEKNQNLRDHMTALELIFTMLGEQVTTEISQQEKPETFSGNRQVARRGGQAAGVARAATEKEIGRSVVSEQNFLDRNPINLLDDPNIIPEDEQ